MNLREENKKKLQKKIQNANKQPTVKGNHILGTSIDNI